MARRPCSVRVMCVQQRYDDFARSAGRHDFQEDGSTLINACNRGQVSVVRNFIADGKYKVDHQNSANGYVAPLAVLSVLAVFSAHSRLDNRANGYAASSLFVPVLMMVFVLVGSGVWVLRLCFALRATLHPLAGAAASDLSVFTLFGVVTGRMAACFLPALPCDSVLRGYPKEAVF